jgi:DNA-binding transcriptional ArsR family regulator
MDEEAVFRAVSDPTRRAILSMLAEGERSAGDLHAPFAMSQPAVSRHLRVLREAGLVGERAAGRQRIYALRPEPLRSVADWVGHYERFWVDRLERFGAALDRAATE